MFFIVSLVEAIFLRDKCDVAPTNDISETRCSIAKKGEFVSFAPKNLDLKKKSVIFSATSILHHNFLGNYWSDCVNPLLIW